MKRGIISFFTALIVIISMGGQAFCQDAVSGVWRRAEGVKIINNHIEVQARDTLVIESGLQVRFMGNYNFTIYGTLIAEGTEDAPITFISQTASPGAWGGIRLEGRSSSGSHISYCNILYGYKGLWITSSSSPLIDNSEISRTRYEGIHLDGSNSIIEDCTILNSGRNGMIIEGNSFPEITRNTFDNCEDHGISTSSSSRPTITENIISVSGNGIHLNSPNSTIAGNFIYDCDGMGIFVRDNAHASQLRDNIITLINGSYGIELYNVNSVLVQNNSIVDCDASAIYAYSGNSNILQNNIITSNSNHGIQLQNCAVTLLYNNVWGNQGDDYSGTDPGVRDLSQNPMLDNDFVPTENSPMIDAGDPQSPLDPDGTRADMGAMFFNQNMPPVILSFQPEQFEVLDEGGVVDFSVSAIDSNGHDLIYFWYVGEQLLQQGVDSTFSHDFEGDGAYSVVVVVDDNFYMGQTAHQWDFSVDVDVEEVTFPNEFQLSSVYPNPFNSTARFSLTASGYANIRIWDMSGRLIQQLWNGSITTGQHSYLINASEMPTGKYILSAETSQGRLTNSFVVVK